MKHLAILGSTGSIGRQTLEVVEAHPDQFSVEILTANHQVQLLAEQARRFHPDAVVIADETRYETLKNLLADEPCKVYAGSDAVSQVACGGNVDTVVVALVGYSGLLPTMKACASGKTVCLANKESLVVAGELITDLVNRYHAALIPVDSEHSAIFQCLVGEGDNPVEKLILTASGGPFRGKKREDLIDVTPEAALRHPNWNMGAKVTIDSASLMNKGFEVLEARWLFGIPAEKIEVVVHPQSIVHSMVQFADGCVKAQLGAPDMRLPIQYALSFPDRWVSAWPRADFSSCALTFEKPDITLFRNLALAYEAIHRGGNAPCILNAANEVAVEAFLSRRVSFLGMSELIEQALEHILYVKETNYEVYVESDAETRRYVRTLLPTLN